jgi:hypothetical protein
MRALWREDQLATGQRLFGDEELEDLIPKGDWIPAKQAAALLGMEPDPFRASYCNPAAPRVRFWQRKGPNGGRRILVDRASVRALVAEGLNPLVS